jgi:hypothetical protein
VKTHPNVHERDKRDQGLHLLVKFVCCYTRIHSLDNLLGNEDGINVLFEEVRNSGGRHETQKL